MTQSIVDEPYITALVITVLFDIGFFFYIRRKTQKNKKKLKEDKFARLSILSTSGYLILITLYWIGNLFIYHPEIATNTTAYCTVVVLLRAFGAYGSQYCSQLFFIFRIGAILKVISLNKYTHTFYQILLIFSGVLLISNFTIHFNEFANIYPNFIGYYGRGNSCSVPRAGYTISICLGCYQLIILFTFIYIISKIFCPSPATSTSKSRIRIIRTIIAGLFVSLRVFLFPIYADLSIGVRFWFAMVSNVCNSIALLSDYYDYGAEENMSKKKKKNPVQFDQERRNDTKTIPISTYNAIEMSAVKMNSTTVTVTNSTPMEQKFDAEKINTAFIEAIDNGFTGKNIDVSMAVVMNNFWKQHYLKSSEEFKERLDDEINIKLKNSISKPEHYESRSFPYLRHLNKFFIGLLRVDIDLENKLRGSWGTLHSALNISANDCELVLGAIIEALSEHFDHTIFNMEVEYVFCRHYRLAVTLMLNHDQQGFLNKIIDLNEKNKELISNSLDDCLQNEIGRDILHSYLRVRAAEIYLFLKLIWKYEGGDGQDTDYFNKFNVVQDIMNVSIDCDAMFAIQIDQDLREQFMNLMHSESNNVYSEYQTNPDKYDTVLCKLKDTQIDIVRKKHWKTFVLFLC